MSVAEMRAPATYFYARDRASTAGLFAFFSSFLIGVVFFLKFTAFAENISVVGHGVTTEIYASR